MKPRSFSVVAAVNDEQVLGSNLARSPMLGDGIELIEEWGHSSASAAYNAGLERTDAEIVVFAHQDVYLPRGWLAALERGIESVEERDEDWAVLGLIGLTPDGETVGRVYSSGIGREIGSDVREPTPTVTIDEMVIVLRPASGVRFDADLPCFHLYGTDVVHTALAAGLGAYVVQAPAVHNSNPVLRLDDTYGRAYAFMRRKWRSRLPIPNLIVPITRFGWPLVRERLRMAARALVPGRTRKHPTREPDGAAIASRLGYESG